MATDNSVVSTRKAAEMLGVSLRTAQLWVESGVLQAWKTAGNHRRVYVSSIERLLRERAGAIPSALVVEDDTVMQAYYTALFDEVESKVNLDVADDGFQGLLKIGSDQPDLIIVDIDMPNMNGIEMIRALLGENDEAKDFNVAIVTSLTDDEIAARGGAPENIPVYRKPLSRDAFAEILKLLPGQPTLKTDTTEENAS